MSGWRGPLALVLLACVALIAIHSTSAVLLKDTDTGVLLQRIDERHAPMSWFATDWPLENHFYRPITTLSFSFDRSLFGDNPTGFAISAAVYCALCVLALFWLALELSGRPAFAASCALLFAFWQTPINFDWNVLGWIGAVFVVGIGLLRHRFKGQLFLPAAVVAIYLAIELAGVHRKEAPEGLYVFMLAWLPSRTASIMTLFALCALAAYARFERLGAPLSLSAPSPLDLPATSNSVARRAKRTSRQWAALSCACLALALGSYEQAAMLPITLLVVGVSMQSQGHQVRWRVHAAFWAVLFFYLAVRSRVLPPGPSPYQMQQLRTGASTFFSEMDYVMPSVMAAYAWWQAIFLGWAVFFSALFYVFPLQISGNLTGYATAFSRTGLARLGWLCSVLAFMPMAFLKPFAHYHYWPMAMRSLFVIALVGAAWQLFVIAASPRAVRAPGRHAPAPGSLHHP